NPPLPSGVHFAAIRNRTNLTTPRAIRVMMNHGELMSQPLLEASAGLQTTTVPVNTAAGSATPVATHGGRLPTLPPSLDAGARSGRSSLTTSLARKRRGIQPSLALQARALDQWFVQMVAETETAGSSTD